jgi:ribosomal protein L19E
VDAPAPDYRFARPDVAELMIAMATKGKSATGRCRPAKVRPASGQRRGSGSVDGRTSLLHPEELRYRKTLRRSTAGTCSLLLKELARNFRIRLVIERSY